MWGWAIPAHLGVALSLLWHWHQHCCSTGAAVAQTLVQHQQCCGTPQERLAVLPGPRSPKALHFPAFLQWESTKTSLEQEGGQAASGAHTGHWETKLSRRARAAWKGADAR